MASGSTFTFGKMNVRIIPSKQSEQKMVFNKLDNEFFTELKKPERICKHNQCKKYKEVRVFEHLLIFKNEHLSNSV